MLTAVMGRVKVNDIKIFTRYVGAGAQIVVLHGGPGAHHDYLLPQYDELAMRRRLIYYDQRGGGNSRVDPDTPVGWREHVADLHALREKWKMERMTLLGYSWGGLLALLYLTQHPEAVERLALVAPAPLTRQQYDEFANRVAARMGDPKLAQARKALQESGLRERNPDGYRRRAFALSVWAYFRDPERYAEGLTPFTVTERTEQAVWASLGDYDLRPALSGTKTPTLIVHGRHDPLPLESSEEMASTLGARLVIIEGAGHAPHVETTEELVSHLDAFLPPA